MKINEERLTSETKKLEQILGRKQFKRGYENEFQNVAMYDEILYSLCFRDLSKEAMGLIVELVANVVILDLPVEE